MYSRARKLKIEKSRMIQGRIYLFIVEDSEKKSKWVAFKDQSWEELERNGYEHVQHDASAHPYSATIQDDQGFVETAE
ncbi:hypothetical protein Bca4012_011219 [Brassica carinata]|uniref:Uncharacterized protein n=1 Tax=Brassica carinata TaxID=52824 RepID=A0A8X7S244_BRACI|nr:hypothetical protein Bca52824_036120 [Brassica carinata]